MLAALLSADAIHGPLCRDLNKEDQIVDACSRWGTIKWRDHADRMEQCPPSRHARYQAGLETSGRQSTNADDLCHVSLGRILEFVTFLDPIFLVIEISDSFPERTTKSGMVVALSCIRYSSGLIRRREKGRPIGFHASLSKEVMIMLGTILLILLILMVLGSAPTWPYSRNWGYFPSGGLGLVLLILVVLILLGRVPIGF